MYSQLDFVVKSQSVHPFGKTSTRILRTAHEISAFSVPHNKCASTPRTYIVCNIVFHYFNIAYMFRITDRISSVVL